MASEQRMRCQPFNKIRDITNSLPIPVKTPSRTPPSQPRESTWHMPTARECARCPSTPARCARCLSPKGQRPTALIGSQVPSSLMEQPSSPGEHDQDLSLMPGRSQSWAGPRKELLRGLLQHCRGRERRRSSPNPAGCWPRGNADGAPWETRCARRWGPWRCRWLPTSSG